MEEGHRVHDRVADIIARPFQHAGLLEDGAVVAIGQLHALGHAGSAGCIELDDIIVVARREARWIGQLAVAPCRVGFPILPIAINRDDMFKVWQFGADLVNQAVEIFSDEQDFHPRIRQDEFHFGCGESGVDGGHRCAGLGGAEQHLVIDSHVLGEIADPVIRFHAQADQAVGNLGGTCLQFGEAGCLAFEPESLLIRADAGLDARDIG